MRSVPDHGPYYDVRGVAIQRFTRVAFCRDGSLRLAYVAQVSPYMILLEPETRRYSTVSDSRLLVVVDEAAVESEVKRTLKSEERQ